MPKTRSPSVLGSGRILYLPTARIRPNPMQPRKHFDTGGLQELAEYPAVRRFAAADRPQGGRRV